MQSSLILKKQMQWQNAARRFLGPSIPTQGEFEREVMYLQQIRGDLKSRSEIEGS